MSLAVLGGDDAADDAGAPHASPPHPILLPHELPGAPPVSGIPPDLLSSENSEPEAAATRRVGVPATRAPLSAVLTQAPAGRTTRVGRPGEPGPARTAEHTVYYCTTNDALGQGDALCGGCLTLLGDRKPTPTSCGQGLSEQTPPPGLACAARMTCTMEHMLASNCADNVYISLTVAAIV